MSWFAPFNGGNPISSYDIIFADSTGTNFHPIAAYCNGNSSTIVQRSYCDIPFTVFRASPFNLQQDQLIVAKMAATNTIGTGAYSTLNTAGVEVEVQPLAPLQPPTCNDYSETTAVVNMHPLTGQSTGSSLILFYELSWDQGTNGASWVTYTVTSTLQVLVTSLTSGQQYKFRYRGQNVNGWGPYSPVLTIVAMVVPFQVQPVVTTYQQTSIKVAWTAPYSGA